MGSVRTWAEQQERGWSSGTTEQKRVELNSEEKCFWSGKHGTMFKTCIEMSFDFDPELPHT